MKQVLKTLIVGVAFVVPNMLSAAAEDAGPTTLQTVLKRGKLVVGTRSSVIGFSFKDAKGQLVGLDIDVSNLLAKKIFGNENAVELAVLPGGGDRVPALVSKRVDVVVSSFSPYPERVQVVDFTQPYCISDSVFIVRNNSPFKANADLNGKTIFTRQGDDIARQIQTVLKDPKIEGYPDLSDAFLAFRQGRGDAFFHERAAAVYMIKNMPGQFRLLVDNENPIARSAISVGLRKGDQEWLNYLNWLLFDMKANNELQAAHVKWFGSHDLEPNWVKQPL
jgi:polar amino acid transport system substrate-binding protein